ncbi:MAG: 4-hydroxy-tetrahydrodipicolinate synthase [Bacteroides sp.]|nr:4-hydroxy-tetrahydrodipicolinate synthase [Bacteroides sp.]
MIYKGTGVAIITPFTSGGEVDYDTLILLTDRLIENGINYLVVLGTTAETPTLSSSEKKDVIRCVVDSCAGRVPIIVGAGGNDTLSSIRAIDQLDKNGIDAILSVVPYYNKPTQEGIYQHYSAIAAASELPLMLYNVPGRTGTNMSASTTLRLANDYPGHIIAIKEASGDLDQLTSLLSERPEGFHVISGDDAITLPLIAMGGDGVVSVIGNGYPDKISSLVNAALKGDYEGARNLHYSLSPMIRAIFKEGNPAGIKAAMEIRGWCENVLRLPLVPATDKLFQEIRQLDAVLR